MECELAHEEMEQIQVSDEILFQRNHLFRRVGKISLFIINRWVLVGMRDHSKYCGSSWKIRGIYIDLMGGICLLKGY